MKNRFKVLFVSLFVGLSAISMSANSYKDIAPKYAEIKERVVENDIWKRENQLSVRDRSLITISSYIAKGIFNDGLKEQFRKAIENGSSKKELAEVITHLAFYTGEPNAESAFDLLREIPDTTKNINARKKPTTKTLMLKKETPGKNFLGNFAPKFGEVYDNVVLGEIWSREEELSLRDRSMITISALMSMGIFDDTLKGNLNKAMKYGLSKDEIIEEVTHLSFYTGMPRAWNVFAVLQEVLDEGQKQ